MSTSPPSSPPPVSPLATPRPWHDVAPNYAAEVMPAFGPFATRALELAAVPAGGRIVDVACGPGTLALLAARAGLSVDALDFAPAMIALLDETLAREGVTNVRAQVGDGQALPYADATFDAGFSCFGLMFFPDRARGYAELRRVLRPGARAVVTSWLALAPEAHLAVLFGAMREELARRFPDRPAAAAPRLPLAEADDHVVEMSAAGFGDVRVERFEARLEAPSLDELWAGMARTNVAVIETSRQLGAAWPEVAVAIRGALAARFGEGAQTMRMPAWIAVGTA